MSDCEQKGTWELNVDKLFAGASGLKWLRVFMFCISAPVDALTALGFKIFAVFW